MKQKIGMLIKEVDIRNTSGEDLMLFGVSISKDFIKSVANVIGTDLRKYKVVAKNQFVCSLMQVSRDEKIPIALWGKDKSIIVSPAYKVFQVTDENIILPEYLALWFKREEFDREASYYGVGGVRGSLEWEDFCDLTVPVPSIAEQREIVDAYNDIERRIALKRKINDNLEAQARAIFRQFIASSSDIHTYQMTELFDIKYGKGLATSDLQEKGYFVFGSNGLIGRYTQYMYEKEQITISCRGASSGKVNISLPKSFITSNSLILECKKPYQYEFLKAFCKTFSFEEYVTGSAQPQLTIDSLLNVSVELPDLSNIHGISSVLGAISAAIQTNTLELISILENRELLLDTILHL